MYPKIIAIGTSDNLGGAGIQADIGTFADFKCYAANIIVSVTAQGYKNKELFFQQEITEECIRKQFEYIIKEFSINTIKTGMLPSEGIISCIAEQISKYKDRFEHIIVDPVLTNNLGQLIFSESIVELMKNKIIPLATEITPNFHEFRKLFKTETQDLNEISKVLPCKAMIKFGDIENNNTMIDYCFDKRNILKLEEIKIDRKNIRGDGCRLASAITALLSQGHNFFESCKNAKKYVWNKIKTNQVISEEKENDNIT